MWKALVSPLLRLAERSEHTVNRADRSKVQASTEQLREHLRGRLVNKLGRVHNIDNGLPFHISKTPWARRAQAPCRWARRASRAIQRRATHAKHIARGFDR